MKQKGKQNIIHIVLISGIISLLLLFTIPSIYVNPGDSITYQIDSPLETYTWSTPYNVSTIIIASTYIVFNETGFNVTSSNPISIEIDDIDDDIWNPADGDEILLAYTVTNIPGNTWFNLSGFEPTVSYTIKINTVYFDTSIANSSGCISFYDNPGANDEYIIYWTTGSNHAPVTNTPVPADTATGISTSPTLQATINDLDGNPMTYYIRTNESGSWTTLKTDTGEPNGTISTATSGKFISDYTKYWWSVNLTDAIEWTNNTFSFTTTGSGLPVVQTNSETNLQEINVTFNGELINDGGEDCTAWFEWGNTTNELSHNTTNQTVTSGEEFTVSVRGNLTDWYDSDWLYRKQITINHEYLSSGALTNYPLFINDTDSYYQYAQDSLGSLGYDFIFTSNDGVTLLDFELVRFSYGLNNIEAYVNVSRLSDTSDTTIYLYWGNPSATNMENSSGTWDSNYTAVYHLNEQSGSDCYDSSSHSNDATYMGSMPTRLTAKCGYGQWFDGVGDYIDLPQGVHLAGNGTVLLWIDDGSTYEDPEAAYLPGTTRYFYLDDVPDETNISSLYRQPTDEWVSYGLTGSGVSWNIAAASYHNYNWYMLANRVTTDTINIFRDADEVGETNPDHGIPDNNNDAEVYVGYQYMGSIDEVRVSNIRRNDSWMKVEHYSMNQTEGFITYWDAETEYSDTGNMTAGTLYRYRAVANNTQGTAYGDNVTFLTHPYEPTLFAALKENRSAIQLTWVQIDGSGYNKTYIERKNSSTPWSRGGGTEIYNGTLLIFNDTGLSWDTYYYYQAWSFTNWTDTAITYMQYSTNFDSANNKTNSLPVFSNQIPVNNSVVDVGVDISITINDPDGDTFNWTIDTLPDIGNDSGNDESNGTKTCSIAPGHNVNYTWFVNCTDGYDWYNVSYNFTSMIQYVAVPVGGSSDYDTTNNRLNLSWTNYSGINETYRTDNYVVVQRNDTYATSATQSGNWIRQNGSAAWFNVSWTETSGGYFTIFGYNNTALMYSYNNETPLGLNIPWGALALSCFSENNPETALTFNIEISNSTFTVTYAATGLTNIHYIDMEDIPYGTDTIFQVSSDDYETRSTTMDIFQNNFYNLIFYLPLSIPPGGSDDPDYDENETYSEDYVIHVVGPQSEYGVDPPIEDAEVIIRKYINTTESYENVGVYITSADGTFTVPLLPNQLYSFNISADGYYDEVESWMPVEIVFEGDRHHTFRLTPLSGGDVPGVGYDIFWDTITFTGVMNDIDGLNGTITIAYNDVNLSTTDTQIYIYEIYGDTSTLIATISNTSTNSFTYTTGVINTTRLHTAVLYFNNTANFDVNSPLTLPIYNINVWTERTPFDIEDRVTNIFGPFSLGYANLIAAFLAIIALVMFGPHNTGIGIIASGFTLGITSYIFSIMFTSGAFNGGLTIIIPLIVIIGGMYILVKNPGGHL